MVHGGLELRRRDLAASRTGENELVIRLVTDLLHRRSMPKRPTPPLAIFKFLLTFYEQNKKRIRVSYRDLSKKFLDFNDPENAHAYLRTPQNYVFLKSFDNKRIEQIFKDWYEKKGVFADRAEGGVASDDGQISLFEDFSRNVFKPCARTSELHLRADHGHGQNHSDGHVHLLRVHPGQQIRMRWCSRPTRCEELFDLSKVVPPEYLLTIFLEEAGTSLDTLDQSMFNVIVSNTQKIILKRKNKEKTADLFGATPDTFGKRECLC